MSNIKESFLNPLRENLSLAVYNTGYEKCSENHIWGPGTRDHYLIHYICSGSGTFYSGNNSYTLTKGDLFLITPSKVVSYVADDKEPWEYYWVGFNGTEAKRMISLSGLSEDDPVLQLSDVSEYKDLLYNIYKSSGNSPSDDANMIGYLYLFLGQLIKDQGQIHNTYETRDYIAEALKYIQYNFSTNIGVTNIADYVGISRSQLYRTFMASYNISPSDYLQNYRINRACSLLRDSTLTITEIANSVGFSDPLYFSRVFKKSKGVSPTKYQDQFFSSKKQ